MKEKSLFKQFIQGFIKAFAMIAFMIAVGVVSYQVTMFYYKTVEDYSPVKTGTVVKDIVTDATVDEISQNLIYSFNDETGEIEQIVLEIFNTYTSNLDYITIPVNTQFAVSNDMFQRLSGVNPDIPQIIKLSEVSKYFEADSVYAYGTVMLEDLLGTDISFYTVIPASAYSTMFATVSQEVTKPSDGVAYKMDIQQISTTVQSEFFSIKDKNDMEDYISSYYDKIKSNLSLKNRLKYAEKYLTIKPEFVYYHGIYGQEKKTNYEIDVEAAKQQIIAILQNETYSVAQAAVGEQVEPDTQKGETDNNETDNNGTVNNDTGENATSSKGLNIQILNGSNITGLGSYYKQKLSDAGYTVLGVGNYTEAILTNTKIIVKNEGIGLDIKEYFNGAVLETGQLEAGIDIQIILGTADDSTE